MKLHVLCSCRNPELWTASILVFKTIRTGFPDAKILVTDNGLDSKLFDQLKQVVAPLDIEILPGFKPIVHHTWITGLLQTENEPFFICDTDVIFWDRFPVEAFAGHTMAGRLIPKFFDAVTQCITHSRLHTALMYLEPVAVRFGVEKYYKRFPNLPFNNLRPDLVTGRITPIAAAPAGLAQNGYFYDLFHDTCSMLYVTVGGRAFTDAELDCYDHLNCGTYSDLVGDILKNDTKNPLRLQQRRNERLMAYPSTIRGLWREQEAFYAEHAVR
jgi:hypothetical protein